MAKEKKHTGTKDQMDSHAHQIIDILNSIDSHLSAMIYYSQESRGFAADIEKAVAQPYVSESKKLEDKIEALVIKELKKFNEENK